MAAIIFDLDGTIADSFDFVADFLAEKKNGEHLDSREKRELYGLSMLAMARKMGHPWWRLLRLLFEGRKEMGKIINQVPVFAGLPEAIRKLQAEGHELFIVSSNTTQNIHAFLAHHELQTYFLEVYGGASLNKSKTLKALLREQSIDVADAIYIGDETRDIKAAHAVNMRIVAVTWGFASKEDLRNQRPTAMVHTPGELLAFLEEL
ncbi:MAG: HAD-IA family hydrolase [Candidatus Saccharimonadales bacterium]